MHRGNHRVDGAKSGIIVAVVASSDREDVAVAS